MILFDLWSCRRSDSIDSTRSSHSGWGKDWLTATGTRRRPTHEWSPLRSRCCWTMWVIESQLMYHEDRRFYLPITIYPVTKSRLQIVGFAFRVHSCRFYIISAALSSTICALYANGSTFFVPQEENQKNDFNPRVQLSGSTFKILTIRFLSDGFLFSSDTVYPHLSSVTVQFL